MAKPHINIDPEDTITETTIRDMFGAPILIITHAVIYELQGNNYIERRRNETIELSDGFEWHAGMLSANPPIHISVCNLCRYPLPAVFPERPTSGLVRTSSLEYCHECGLGICPKHRRRSRYDRRWRCLKCHKSFQKKTIVKRTLRSIFCTRR